MKQKFKLIENVMYHGTTKDFENLKADPDSYMIDRALGVHFAADPAIAHKFAHGVYDKTSNDKARIFTARAPSRSELITVPQKRFYQHGPNAPEREGLASDQASVQAYVTGHVFSKDRELFKAWVKSVRGIDDATADKLYDSLSKGVAPTDQSVFGLAASKNTDFQSYVYNFGGTNSFNKQIRNQFLADMEKAGKKGLVYKNTSPTEMEGVRSSKCYIIFNPGNLKYIGFGRYVKPGENVVSYIKKDGHFIPFHAKEERQLDEFTSQAAAQGLPDRGRLAGSTERLAPSSRSRLTTPLGGLPQNVKVNGQSLEIGPLPQARQAAYDYMKSTGLSYHPPTDYVRVDKDRAAQIAVAFDHMRHEPNNPMVKEAYTALVKECLAQFKFVQKTGLDIDFIDYEKHGDPYAASPRLATEDVRKNNHLWVLPTSAAFGSSEQKIDATDDPMLAESGVVIKGHKLLNNDIFRIVHDYFGHIKEGNGFRADGEENAWRSHAAMFTPLARMAMTAETRGQNSWVNFGPYGQENQHADSAHTHFADQKMGLLPIWAMENGSGQPLHSIQPMRNKIMDQAKRLGLVYIGYGRFEKRGEDKVSYIKKGGQLVPFQRKLKEAVDLYGQKLEGIKGVHADLYVRHTIDSDGRHNYAVSHQGRIIARAKLSGQGHYVTDVSTEPEFQHKGIASKLYDHIEKHTGKKLEPSPMYQTAAGKALWNHRNKSVQEDSAAPANCAGGGAVAGIGVGPQGEPGVKRKKRVETILGVVKRKPVIESKDPMGVLTEAEKAQDKIHMNPAPSMLGALAKNAEHGAVRIAVDDKDNLWAGDGNKFLHCDLGVGKTWENVSKHKMVGYVTHVDGKHIVQLWHKNTSLTKKATHPKVDALFRHKSFIDGNAE